jgi:hypothetical protein
MSNMRILGKDGRKRDLMAAEAEARLVQAELERGQRPDQVRVEK